MDSPFPLAYFHPFFMPPNFQSCILHIKSFSKSGTHEKKTIPLVSVPPTLLNLVINMKHAKCSIMTSIAMLNNLILHLKVLTF